MNVFKISDLRKIFFLVCVVLFSACKKDSKEDNNSVDAFLGIYEVLQDCDSNTEKYTITVTKSSGNEVLVKDFFRKDRTIKATVDGDILTIKSQKSGDFILNGTGSLNKATNTLMIRFSYYEDGYECTAKCVKP